MENSPTQEVIIAKFRDRKELILDSNSSVSGCEYYTLKNLSREEIDAIMRACGSSVQSLLDKHI